VSRVTLAWDAGPGTDDPTPLSLADVHAGRGRRGRLGYPSRQAA